MIGTPGAASARPALLLATSIDHTPHQGRRLCDSTGPCEAPWPFTVALLGETRVCLRLMLGLLGYWRCIRRFCSLRQCDANHNPGHWKGGPSQGMLLSRYGHTPADHRYPHNSFNLRNRHVL